MINMGNQYRTNQEFRPEPEIPRQQIVRAKVVRVPTRTAPPAANCAIVKVYDGINLGTTEIPVETAVTRAVDDVIYVYRPAGGTEGTNPETATDTSDPDTEFPLIWREIPPGLEMKYGVIHYIAPCNAYVKVYESDGASNVIGDTEITVLPVASTCGLSSNATGFCYDMGAEVPYWVTRRDDTIGYQINPYRPLLVKSVCTDTTTPANTPSITDSIQTAYYNGDFFVQPNSTCGGTVTNAANIFSRGNVVLAYNLDCGLPTADNKSGVKVFDFDKDHHTPGVIFSNGNTNYARIQFDIVCAAATEGQPTVNGSLCVDASAPKKVTIIGFYGVQIIEYLADVSCDGSGGLVKTFATMRVLVPL